MSIPATWISSAIEDAADETFDLFSQSFPSHNLGYIDCRTTELDLEIGDRSISIRQSPAVFTSARNEGTTGAVLWKITPLVGEWLASLPTIFAEAGILNSQSTVVELGCGIAGLIGILVAPKIHSYILTDQAYVMKTLQINLAANKLQTKRRPKAPSPVSSGGSLTAVALDWEKESPSRAYLGLQLDEDVDLVVVCDCVYNDYLVTPLVDSLKDLCRLNSSAKPSAVLVAQQLRSEEVFEAFLSALLVDFHVWRISDGELPASLRSGSGYAVHIAWLRLWPLTV
jgi:hypothetical protein